MIPTAATKRAGIAENYSTDAGQLTKDKLVYFIKQPLTHRDSDRFGIDFFSALGHPISVIDMTQLIHPETPQTEDEINADNLTIYEVSGWDQIEQYRSIISDAKLAFFLIQSNGLSKATLRPLRLLTKLKIPYVIFSATPVPGLNIKSKAVGLLLGVRDLIKRITNMSIGNSVLSRIPPSWLGVRKADYMVLPSQVTGRVNNLTGDGTKLIETHSFDFELFLRDNNPSGVVREQAVFIDQYIPYHRDYVELNANELDADSYYTTLRQLFDRLERELGLEVTVAAHPRTDCRDHQKGFGNRKVHYNDTMRLVYESKLVLGHNSTALSFAVMFKKPVMLLVTKPLYERHFYEKYYFQAYAEALGTPLRFIDVPETSDLSDPYFIDEKLYAQYINRYIKCPNSPNQPYWETVSKSIPNLTATT